MDNDLAARAALRLHVPLVSVGGEPWLGNPSIKFSACIPLRTASGDPMGVLCVGDFVPRVLDETELSALVELAVV